MKINIYLQKSNQITLFILLVALALLNFANVAEAWTWSADFELGTNGTRAIGNSGYNGPDTGTQTFFSNLDSNGGEQSSLFEWTTPDSGYSECTGEIDYPAQLVSGDEIWIRAYYKFDNNWSWNNVSGDYGTKILRNHNRHQDGTNGKYISIMTRNTGAICLSMEPSLEDYEYCSNTFFDIGSWQSLELYIKLNSVAGIVRIWKDGILVYETDQYRTMEVDTDLSNYALVMSTWNGGVSQDQNMWVDDIQVTSDVPNSVDLFGNKMIGPVGWVNGDLVAPSPPTELGVL